MTIILYMYLTNIITYRKLVNKRELKKDKIGVGGLSQSLESRSLIVLTKIYIQSQWLVSSSSNKI